MPPESLRLVRSMIATLEFRVAPPNMFEIHVPTAPIPRFIESSFPFSRNPHGQGWPRERPQGYAGFFFAPLRVRKSITIQWRADTLAKKQGNGSMPGVFDRQKAVFDFRKFVSTHRAWQGRHVNLAAARAGSADHAVISKDDALGVFIQLHPEHADSRSAINTDFDGQECFTFSKERWDETIKGSSAVKPK